MGTSQIAIARLEAGDVGVTLTTCQVLEAVVAQLVASAPELQKP